MKLSNRMEAVAAMVSPARVVADIGTDHGYVPVALVERGVALRAIAADVRPGPLSHAQQTIAREGLGDRISTRLSDGLAAFEPGEADAIVIAGMGGALMIRILTEGHAAAHSAKELILQPQSEIAEVRRFLLGEGYVISDEEMLCEDGKFYTVMKVSGMVEYFSAEENTPHRIDSLESSSTETYSEPEYVYGRILLQKSHPVLLQYLKKEKRQLEKILEGLPQDAASPQISRRREEILHKRDINTQAIAKYYDRNNEK